MKQSIIEWYAIIGMGILVGFLIGYGIGHKTTKHKSAYQLYLVGDYYVLMDGDRVVWRDKVGSNSEIDHLILEDNL